MLSTAEENYLKAIFRLESETEEAVPTGALASVFGIQAPSVTDMIKKLAEKKLLNYEKSRGVRLTPTGRRQAVAVVRKHRIWETFLVQTLEFGWDEVHDLAEQLEHVHSEELVNRLEVFLGYPKFDPHGDPIPDANGKMVTSEQILLNLCLPGKSYKLMGIREDSQDFLKYLTRIGLKLGSTIQFISREPFDQSLTVRLNNKTEHTLSSRVAALLSVVKI